MAKTIEQGIKDQESKTEDVRKLEKLGENHFKLTISNEGARLVTIKEFDKKELREVYSEVKQNIANLKSMKSEQKRKAKMLTDLPEDKQDEIEDFIHMLSQVKQYQEADNAKAAIPNIEKQIDFLELGQKEIELVVPEVLRNK